MGLLRARKVIDLPRRGRHVRHAPWSGTAAMLDARISELERRIADFDRRFAALALRTRMQMSLGLSLLLHLVLIFGVTFKMPDPAKPRNLDQPLEVVLVNTKSPTKPVKPDALAQHNLDGGGNTDADRRAKSPLPAVREDKQTVELALAAERVEQLEHEARKLMTQARSEAKVESAPPQPEPQAETPTALNAANLMQRSLEIARLEAQISKDWDAYQKRPRRQFIGARTQEFRFARYIEDWRAKIERIGELNYPQAARDRKIYGSLVMTVSIKSDGTLENVEINRSSGERILDDAALRIVRLSAPFAPFPADIARDTDVLDITRTWMFTRSDQLVTQ
ncbi:MAG: energy transducer TonB [Burkholderiales bacterium]|nr:energy transducer TonB [Burkholderiales bacterium]